MEDVNDKLILSIDTSGRACSVAIGRGGRIYGSEYADTDMTMHSRTVMKMIDHVLTRTGRTTGDIDVFAANVGPGSFTGVRIGICTAKGLAKAAEKKVFSADALDALAIGAGVGAENICAMIDAGRGEAYYAFYQDGEKTVFDEAAPIEEILRQINAPTVFAGDGAEVYRTIIEKYVEGAAYTRKNQTRAEDICILAAMADESRFTEPEQMSANYIRESGAVRKKCGDR